MMLSKTIEILNQGISSGMHLGAQLYLSQGSRMIADTAVGEARPGVPMTPDSITHWWSSVKPITAVAVCQLCERGRLDVNDTVSAHIPEFGVGSKESITIRHVLTHTGGFRGVWSNSIPDPWEKIIADVCAAPIERDWVPGQKGGYHRASGWFILAEIVRRLDGRMIDQFVREEIFLPLGMKDSWIGIPLDQFDAYKDRISPNYSSEKSSVDVNSGPMSPDFISLVRPGGNGRGPIRELGRFYEMLLNGGTLDGATVLSPQTVREMTTPQRIGMFDHTFKHVIDFGLGFIVNSNKYGAETVPYGYGQSASEHAFGHSGAQSSCAFCDPDRRLVVAWVCNGMPGEGKHQQRQRAINDAIYEDLG